MVNLDNRLAEIKKMIDSVILAEVHDIRNLRQKIHSDIEHCHCSIK